MVHPIHEKGRSAMDQCSEEFKDGVPEMGPSIEWAKCFGASESQAEIVSRFLDQSICDFNCTGEFDRIDLDQLQAIWDDRKLDQFGQVAAIIKLLGI